MAQAGEQQDSASRRPGIRLAGFMCLGIAMGLPGSLFVAWQYHIDAEPALIGSHFLALSASFIIGTILGQRLIRATGTERLARLGCILAASALGALPWVAPPVAMGLRLSALAVLGASSGVLATALLHALEPDFHLAPAAALNRAGLWFGAGCLLATLVMGVTYFAARERFAPACLAVIPLLVLIAGLKKKALPVPNLTGHGEETDSLRHTLRDLRSIATVLFSLLLFFQFGNEWTVAGWLPVVVIRRTGASPVAAIAILGLYFCSLTAGRMLAQSLLSRMSKRRLLLLGVVAALGGCAWMSAAGEIGVFAFGAILVGLGFAPVYPLVAESLDERFSYHPGFYNGTVSIGILGAMSMPWILGLVAGAKGLEYVLLGPATGSVIVLLLVLLLMFEAHLMGGGADRLRPAVIRRKR
jgi:MFS transporter, FHS family, glucose/mannose:H+ symporter